MNLYHGSNADIEVIDLNKGLRYKDFGKGFYVTPDKLTAIRMAQKKARLFGGTATLITYELDEATLPSDLKIKRFPEKATVEWLMFVYENRDRKKHDSDTRLRHRDRPNSQRWCGASTDQLPRRYLHA